MLGIILSLGLIAAAAGTGTAPSRWEGTTAPQAGQPAAVQTETAPAAPAPQYPPPPATAQRAPVYNKSDLPGGVDEPAAVPPGAVRLEDIKPGTKARQTVNETGPAAAPPAAQPAAKPAPQPAPQPAAKAATPAPKWERGEPQLYDTRMQPAAPPPGHSEPTTWYGPKTTAQPAPAPAPSYPRAAAPSGGCKSDLPGGPCEEAVPAGAKRIEDIKPGTRPKAVAGEPPPPPTPTPVVPPPAARPSYTPPPAPSYPAAAPSRGGCKSDLPGGCEEAAVPSGAVRLEDVKPGTRPVVEGAPRPAAPAAPAPKSTGNIQEKPVGADEGPDAQGKQGHRWE